ncbi:hypothetical protein ACIRSS_26100 [Amycolatopsis sp. NPDC101161]|uniref:hypothetical protein n=1 Tax=Amycolatopsis sp. NPDC101161 TaxID=3363940 RepID=UPI0038221988
MTGRTGTHPVHIALRDHPRLQEGLAEVRRRTRLTEERLRELWDESVGSSLDVLGLGYVQDFEAAVASVRRLRERVHDIYERFFEGPVAEADLRELRDLEAALAEEILALADPQSWARDRPNRPDKRLSPDARPASPAATARQRDTRVRALPAERQEAFKRAQALAPERLDAALREEPRAEAALRRALAEKGMDEESIGHVVDALDDVRNPGLDFAFGAGPGRAQITTARVHAAYRELPGPQQVLVNRANVLDPDFLRLAVLRESEGELSRLIDRFCAGHGITGQERTDLEAAVRRLNEVHRESLHDVAPGETGTIQARTRAAVLDRAATAIGLPTRDEITRRLGHSSAVVELAARSPGHLAELAEKWLRYALEKRQEGKPVATLERYARALARSHVRGLFGELTAAFQLADDAWVIKVPDLGVTVGGTDFVAVDTRTGEVWFGDNKALSGRGLGEVSSLLENIVDNMAADVAEFGTWLQRDDVPLPPKLADAIRRAQEASAEVSAYTARLPRREDITTDAVQRRITKILARKGVGRVVTNAGGELSWLTGAAGKYLAFKNLGEPGPHPPERRIELPEGSAP